jgi:hypothetical protein
VLEVQTLAAPVIIQVSVPVGAGNKALPLTTAEKIKVCPTIGEGGSALTAIIGKEVPRFTLTAEEVANK